MHFAVLLASALAAGAAAAAATFPSLSAGGLNLASSHDLSSVGLSLSLNCSTPTERRLLLGLLTLFEVADLTGRDKGTAQNTKISLRFLTLGKA